MKNHQQPRPHDEPPDRLRRLTLAGLLSAYTARHIPWALAQPVADPERGAFLALSAMIAGQTALDAGLAERLFSALQADDPVFPAAATALLKLINDRQLDPLQLQQVLDDEQSPLAPLPRKIATAWFLGIVGNADTARALAYETALNAQIVSDVLRPPTYCYGVYGSWATKPT